MTTIRKNLSVSALLSTVHQSFKKIKEPRGRKKPTIPLVDCLMSSLAIYGLKFPSLLQYEQHKIEPVIQSLATLH